MSQRKNKPIIHIRTEKSEKKVLNLEEKKMAGSCSSRSGNGVPAPAVLLHSCEICGQSGLTEELLLSHMDSVHIKGAVQCPFCDLCDLTAQEMTIHVNSAHLEYLTPECEDRDFLEEMEELEGKEIGQET